MGSLSNGSGSSDANDSAHPFRWTAASFDKILARIDAALVIDDASLATAA